ncbi:MAG: c-type cytochrome [Caldilineaceae bacterium]|nr:c-type cytochrome [Caldilineaceae bacterium]
MDRIANWLNRNSLYIALITAWVAMCGSLYFSEVRGYVPCVLCWYQRILMYPLTLVVAIGLLRRDWNLPYYVLPFSLIGLGVSTYHYLLEKTDLFAGSTACRQGVSCTTQWINWFGFVTIPFLALTAFLIISIMSVIALVNREPVAEDEEGDALRMPWLPVGGLIVAVLAVFAALFISGTQDPQVAAASTNPFPTLSLTPVAISADAAAHGEQIYLQSCAACHGLDGMGVENLGNQLRASEFLASNSDEQLLAMIRAGRELNDPANTSGLVMPPSGGRPDLSDADILAIIQYLRAE